MELRKFESVSLQDAMNRIKIELGEDALIFSTKEKDFYSYNLKKTCKIYEVFASPSLLSKEEAVIVKSESKKDQIKKNDDKDVSFLNKEILHEISYFDQIKSEFSRLQKNFDLKSDVFLLNQVRDIKLILHDFLREKNQIFSGEINSCFLEVSNKLRFNGVSENFIRKMIDNFNRNFKNREFQDNADFYLDFSIGFIFDSIKIIDLPCENKKNKGKKIFCFIGPTGVGKTTTLLKMAYYFKMTENKRVELLSTNFFRLSTSDQLRFFAKILDCAFFEMTDENELLNRLSLTESDFCFIDINEVSFTGNERNCFLKKISEFNLPIDFHLVLSCNLKQDDIDYNIENFKFLQIRSLIFTKLDEAFSFGEIINSNISSNIPISYFTSGQKVPEDIEKASKERIIERLFKF